MNRAERTLTVVNQRGLHARASAKFVGAVAELDEDTKVQVSRGGAPVAGDSILDLMMLGAAKGDQITVIVEGPQADTVLTRLSAMVEDGFGES